MITKVGFSSELVWCITLKGCLTLVCRSKSITDEFIDYTISSEYIYIKKTYGYVSPKNKSTMILNFYCNREHELSRTESLGYTFAAS